MPPKNQNDDDRLNWRYQDKAYNEIFKAWRKNRRDSVGFFYVDNPNELTYLDGYGFVRDYPEAAERKSLKNVLNVIGVTMIIVGLFDIFHKYIMPALLTSVGVDIYFDRYTKSFYGNEWLILLADTAMSVLKRLVAFIYVYKKMKMPIKVMIPIKVSNRTLYNYSVPMMIFVSGLCASASAVCGGILKTVGVASRAFFDIPDNKAVFALYLLIHIIIIPIISEIHTRGALMQLLRQFGDGFAIIVTAALTGLITYNVNVFCFSFVTSIVIGYFTVRTGSVKTSVIMRITAQAVSYGLFLLDELLESEIRLIAIAAVIFVLTAVGLVFFIRLLNRHSDSFALPFKIRYLGFMDKLGAMASSIPVVVGFTIIIIHTILNIKFVI